MIHWLRGRGVHSCSKRSILISTLIMWNVLIPQVKIKVWIILNQFSLSTMRQYNSSIFVTFAIKILNLRRNFYITQLWSTETMLMQLILTITSLLSMRKLSRQHSSTCAPSVIFLSRRLFPWPSTSSPTTMFNNWKVENSSTVSFVQMQVFWWSRTS